MKFRYRKGPLIVSFIGRSSLALSDLLSEASLSYAMLSCADLQAIGSAGRRERL